ncbi:hypothetical protein DPEC_G00071410 [Dallia pectoralis]|uniref:Uncharacterized protein n=1 Tax=Dallia pectoralis TaxID=75939 RepID=A0ACC2H2V3_DALPE|nr:hypothetical protein DPEC_G00071410 [Dallia pectoralis]
MGQKKTRWRLTGGLVRVTYQTHCYKGWDISSQGWPPELANESQSSARPRWHAIFKECLHCKTLEHRGSGTKRRPVGPPPGQAVDFEHTAQLLLHPT